MPSRAHLRIYAFVVGLALALFCAAPHARAQDEEFDEDAPDPIKLFRQGQSAHARGIQNKSQEDLEVALEFYDRAIKLNPEFAEAEYQRANALAALGREREAEKGLRRAMELKPDWMLPPAALGEMLARAPGREREAEEILRRAVANDSRHLPSLIALAELRKRAGDNKEALELMTRATEDNDATTASIWAVRGELELSAGNHESAMKSFTRAIGLDPQQTVARVRRAELYVESKDFARALKDLQALEEAARTDHSLALAVVSLYGRAEDKTSARRVFETLPEEVLNSPDAQRLRAALDEIACVDTPEAREALERLLLSEPDNASLNACLGDLYRISDAPRSLAYYKRAADLQPTSAKYAKGYAAALVQLRRFPEAAAILKRVVAATPDDYVAHANFATALYELKLYKQAIDEYKWMVRARPDNAVIHYFIGTAHDNLGEYEDALLSYEAFLARADAQQNQLEIDKVNLRLPSLRKQIKLGEGVKKKGRG